MNPIASHSCVQIPVRDSSNTRMRGLAAAGLAISTLLGGCSLADSVGFWSSPEARINDAFFVSDAVRNNHAALMEAADGARKKEIEVRYSGRMKLRALNCSQGYAPSLFSTTADIRKKIGATSCFSEADAELARWTGLVRAGLILAKPPLKALPATAPASTVAEGYISTAAFASEAPIALLEVAGKGVQLVDLESSRVIFRESTSAKAGQLSPNGRLFTTGEGDFTRIRETETGNVVAELPSVRSPTFQWLDARTAAYNRIVVGSDKATLVDFDSGKEVPVTWVSSGLQRAVAVRAVEGQYVLLAGNAITKVALDRKAAEPVVSLVADKQASGVYWANNNSGVTSDGAKFVVAAGKEIRVLDLASLDMQSIAFEPFQVQLAIPTPDPDKIILAGFVQPSTGEGIRALVYSLGRSAVAPIDVAKGASTRFLYASPLRKQGVIAERKIEFYDAPPLQQEVPLAQFVAEVQDLANQRKIAAFEQQAAYGSGFQPAPGTPAAAVAAAAAAVAAATAGQSVIAPAPLAELAHSAAVEGIGVYQGAFQGIAPAAGARRVGTVQVRVRRSSKPIVLVLASYEPVRWIISAEPGARISAILRSGNEQSQVLGGGGARIMTVGSSYAYKPNSPEYIALNRDVARIVGRGIETRLFQGLYEGAQFSVGGN